jgi:cyclopropane fatty-acyl-phospholipid synthase-like methyltransferase
MEIVSNPRKLESAWREQYERRAKWFAHFLPSESGSLAEIGCGRGQLTTPLSRLAVGYKIKAVDRFAGPYAEDRELLASQLLQRRLRNRVSVVVSDYLYWLARQQNGSYNVVISNEFLPEIDLRELQDFLPECYRLLSPRGIAMHGFLSPEPRNARQELVIEADSNPKWTNFPPKEWFSPKAKEVAAFMRESGFRSVRTVRMRSNLTIKSKAAQILLRRWGVKEAFWQSNQSRLRKEGLEIPDWVLVVGKKLV